MLKTPNISRGDLVYSDVGQFRRHYGIVEHMDSHHVRVLWEDGKIGLLYWDRQMMACAWNLRKATDEDAAH